MMKIHMKTQIEILLAVLNVGGRLYIKDDRLQMSLPKHCPPELVAAIEQNLRALTALLKQDFQVITRKYRNQMEAIYWTPDDVVKQLLIVAGVAPNRIYIAAEIKRVEEETRERWTIETMWYGWEAACDQ